MGVYWDLIKIYPKPYLIYSRGTIVGFHRGICKVEGLGMENDVETAGLWGCQEFRVNLLVDSR